MNFLSNIDNGAAQKVMQLFTAERQRKEASAIKRWSKRSDHGTECFHFDQGEKTMTIPTVAYHYWGKRLGYECWEDAQFVREFLRDNPSCKVRSRSRNAQIVVPLSFRGNK